PVPRFSIVVSRAFARLAHFAKACGHLVASGGCLAAMKGALREEELAEMSGWRCSTIELRIPFLDAARSLVICTREASA
ncbi:MAG TPA: RsmG family class I SAM-dependent methyltransferase, partial [Polyangiales bacterium]|nr:RsmG family class I SAM-dependent methyltransferase [Polyangiales bacterium]